MQRKQVKKGKKNFTTSLAGQWLRLCFPIQGVWVRSLVGELRFYMPHSQKVKTLKKKIRNNMVTEFNKDFKNAPRQKNSFKKKREGKQFQKKIAEGTKELKSAADAQMLGV